MFRWYSNATICYAYLVDVADTQDIAFCRWITRGWTLQELIAPKTIRFYSSNWICLGSKRDLQDTLHQATGIDRSVLSTGNFNHVCIARRMAWAANRNTTRVEDQAYSLMGIFDVNMPLIYGEGKKSFLRLQQEILRVYDDQSLFAWGSPDVYPDMHTFPVYWAPPLRGLFADSPKDFSTKHELLPVYDVSTAEERAPPVIHGNGIRVQYPVCKKGDFEFLLTSCTVRHLPKAYIGIPIQQWAPSFYGRCGLLVVIFPEDWKKAKSKTIVVKLPFRDTNTSTLSTFKILRVPVTGHTRKDDPFILDEVYCSSTTTYDRGEHSIAFSWEARIPHAVLFFVTSPDFKHTMRTRKGIFPIHCFALVLGHSTRSPWVCFVPILRDEHVDADFHKLSGGNGKLIKYCMTRDRLKDLLRREDKRQFLPKGDVVDELLAVWLDHPPNMVFAHRYLDVLVDLDTERANLVEDTIFVSIKLRLTNQALKRPVDPQFVQLDDVNEEWAQKARKERLSYRPNWVEVDQWEWFQESAPK